MRGCWDNPYCAFDGPAGTSLVCIHGDWSNVVDGKIKGQLAALALRDSADSPYNPLYARAFQTPRPWGVTTVFAEYTGSHSALDIDWSLEKRKPLRLDVATAADRRSPEVAAEVAAAPAIADVVPPTEPSRPPSFATFWEFALAVNRSNPDALKLAANAAAGDIPIDGTELRKLLGTFWFRSVFPRLSPEWRDRLLNVLVEHVTFPDHAIRNGRRTLRLHEMTQEQRQQAVIEPGLPESIRPDLQLLITVARFWGEEALARFEFTPVPEADASGMALLLQPFRHS